VNVPVPLLVSSLVWNGGADALADEIAQRAADVKGQALDITQDHSQSQSQSQTQTQPQGENKDSKRT
jgi:hypothetical protein